MNGSSSASRSSQRPIALTRLLFLVGGLGAAVIGHSLYALPATQHVEAAIVLGVLALTTGGWLSIRVPGVAANFAIGDTFFITTALLVGPAPATVVIALDTLVLCWKRGFRAEQTVFNLASTSLAMWAAAHTFFLIAQTPPLYDQPITGKIIPALGCLALLYYLLNSGLTALAMAFERGLSAFELWRRHFIVLSLNYFAAASAALFLIVLLHSFGPAAVASLAPVIFVFYLAMRSWLGRLDDANKHVEKVNRLHMSTVSALSTAIEAKDGVTSDHIHRVQAYALGLAKALQIADEPTLRALEAAALLHDTGKLAVPEHILNKPGRLTAAEFETMKTHVDVGADILSAIEFPYPVVPIVRAHHENWDGSGYPRALRGEEIPIGARILSVVDCFDALTSDRPYRSAMSESDALKIIIERRGTMYDPSVVDTFVRVYRDIAPTEKAKPDLQSAVGRIRIAHQAATVPMPAATVADAHVNDTSEEVMALVSLARVATHTPTVRDVAALAWGHLRELVPGASLALYTVDTSRGVLVADYTAGAAAVRLTGRVIAVSERVTGWVAANWRPMVNSEAALDLADGEAGDLRYAVALPLIADGLLVGVMTLYAPERFTDDRVRRLEMVAPHLATAIAAADADRTRPSRPELRVVSRR